MATLTIKMSKKELSQIKTRASHAGFATPAEWARNLVEKNLFLAESPCITPKKIISEMKKNSRYKTIFLHGLKKSLTYADKAA